MDRFAETCQGVIAIDGKVLRRSFDTADAKSPLHMVSAWGCEQGLVLAQIATDAKSNEITAAPKLLEMLALKGTIVTVDALNCQRVIAQGITERGCDGADILTEAPAVTGALVAKQTSMSAVAVRELLGRARQAGVLHELTDRTAFRVYRVV
jgi:predicted transposase YbfD/YdcC